MASHKLRPYYFRGFVISLKDYTETVPQKSSISLMSVINIPFYVRNTTRVDFHQV